MSEQSHLDVNRRHDFVLYFDVTDGNPNGDPDAGNLPRIDPETMQGLVTDVAIKRKVRDWVEMQRGTDAPYKIFVQTGNILNNEIKRAYTEQGLKADKTTKTIQQAQQWMCANFYDIRMFGAVLSTGDNAGQVRGPLQLTFARSVDPISQLDFSVTRRAVTDERDKEKGQTMGRKAFVPYGLYRLHGFFNPYFAAKTKVSQEDLTLFWQALTNLWDFDRSAARGMLACQGLFVFSHESPVGNASAFQLFRRVTTDKQAEVVAPRSIKDYTPISLDENAWPEGVTLTRLV